MSIVFHREEAPPKAFCITANTNKKDQVATFRKKLFLRTSSASKHTSYLQKSLEERRYETSAAPPTIPDSLSVRIRDESGT